LPAAVYLDTNPIDKIPVSLTNSAFNALTELCAQARIPIYIPEICVAEFAEHKRKALPTACNQVRRALRQLHDAISIVEDNCGASPPVPELPDEIALAPDAMAASVDARIRESLGKSGIEIIPSVVVSQERLVDMAVKKIRPFEEKGEKGFKDTLMLYAMVEHARTRRGLTILLVSADDVFDHEDVQAFVRERDVELLRQDSLASARQYIESARSGLRDELLEIIAENQRQFLLGEKTTILDFIRGHMPVDTSFYTADVIGQVRGVERIEVVDVRVERPGLLLPLTQAEGRIEISFKAILDLTVSVVEYTTSNPRQLPLQEGPLPDPALEMFAASLTPSAPVAKTLKREVDVEGSLHVRREPPMNPLAETYSDLQVASATARSVATGLGSLWQYLRP